MITVAIVPLMTLSACRSLESEQTVHAQGDRPAYRLSLLREDVLA